MTQTRFVIAQDKLTRYLLNVNHHTGGSKARFLLAHGFRPDNPDQLAMALIEHARAHWPGSIVPSAWGERHELIGRMPLPDGNCRDVLTVWEIRTGETAANFVTKHLLPALLPSSRKRVGTEGSHGDLIVAMELLSDVVAQTLCVYVAASDVHVNRGVVVARLDRWGLRHMLNIALGLGPRGVRSR